MAKTIEVSGYQVSFERRRYDSQTYTWGYVKLGEEYVSLGDPWPCITPKREDLRNAIKAECERRKLYHIESALLVRPDNFKPGSAGHSRATALLAEGQKIAFVMDGARNTAIVLAASYDWKRKMTLADCKWADIDERDILPGSWPDLCYEIHAKLAA